MEEAAEIMERKGVKPTPNRILVLKALQDACEPMSLSDLELRLPTMDKSSIFRVLAAFAGHDIVHSIEDGNAVLKYEICHGDTHCTLDDMHTHFYCTVCQRTYCFHDIKIPLSVFPDGFEIKSVNYMAKGICPHCANHTRFD